jgi:hypothetical protein
MKKLFVLYALLAVTFSACGSRTSLKTASENETKEVVEKLVYVKDTRTGLCFATVRSTSYPGLNVLSIACVPCDSLKNVEVVSQFDEKNKPSPVDKKDTVLLPPLPFPQSK